MTNLIDADTMWRCETCFHNQSGRCTTWCDAGESYRPAFSKLKVVDAVPVSELIDLRDWLYESDGITMDGLRSLNELIAKYATSEVRRIENGFERRANVDNRRTNRNREGTSNW